MGIIILLIVLAILAVVLLAPIKLRIKYEAEPQISLSFLFLKYRILPKKQPKKKMSRKEFLARLFGKRKRKKKASVTKKASEAHKKKKSSASDILKFIRSASDFLKKILGSFLKRARIKVSKIDIVVATEEASKTAIMYGVISQAVAYMLEILDNFTTLKKSYKGSISVVPDFTKEDSSIKLDICLQYCLLNASGLVISALIYVMKNPDLFRAKSGNSTKTDRRNKKCQKTN